jgi:ABC-type multidrug transport system fused ATPase/permease subunit
MKNRTTVVIAHRLTTIQRADRIIVLARGSIVEVGTHDVLLRYGGQYQRLHAMQFQDVPDA